MAGRFAALTTSAGLTTGTTVKTILALTGAANFGTRVKEVSISFEGTSPTAAKIPTRLLRGGSGGTGTNRNPAAWGSNNPSGSVQATGKENFSANPAGGTQILEEAIHPQGGYTWRGELVLAPGEMLEIQTEAPAAVNARSRVIFEE